MAEKRLNEIPRDLREMFSRGNDALHRENFDYAVALYSEILEKEPGFYECRQALRAAQTARAGNKGGFLKKAFSFAGASPHLAKAQIALHRNPLEAIQIAEQILSGDPYNSAAHKILAEAALAAEMPRTAALSLETLHRHSPKNKALGVQLANTLAEIGEAGRAEEIMTDLYRAHPNDGELAKNLKNISALKTMGEGGYEKLADGEGSYRDILRNKEEAEVLEQEQRAQKTEDVTERLIGEYEARIKTEPRNLKLLRTLAELHTQKKHFDVALAYYDRLKATGMGNDPSLDHAIADTIVRKYDHAVAELNPFAPDHAEQVARINAEKLNFQISECQKRVEKYPTDLAIRFEMGTLYFQAGKISEAIAEFQRSQANPHHRLAAMNYLALCFAQRKMNDLAAKTLQNALKEKVGFDDEKKELLYNLGCVLEAMGKKEEAIEQFKQIYEVDISYKDVAAKVDAFYAGQ